MYQRCGLPWLLMLLGFGQIFTTVSAADSWPEDRTIRIGYLMDSMARAGAINVAIEQAQSDGLLTDYNFRLIGCIYCNHAFLNIDIW